MTADRSSREVDHQMPGDTPPAPLEQDFDAGSLYTLRSAVAAHAAAAGLSPARIYDVLVTAHELAANAVRHGAGHGRLRLQAADGVLTCQVSDDGPDPHQDGNPDAGKPPWPAEHSHGLWLVGQVASKLAIDHGPGGTTVTATFTLTPRQHADR